MILQWLGVGAYALLGSALVILPVVIPDADRGFTFILRGFGALLLVLCLATLVETRSRIDTYRLVEQGLATSSTTIHDVQYDDKPFRGVVVPKVHVYLSRSRKATYLLDEPAARRLVEYIHGVRSAQSV